MCSFCALTSMEQIHIPNCYSLLYLHSNDMNSLHVLLRKNSQIHKFTYCTQINICVRVWCGVIGIKTIVHHTGSMLVGASCCYYYYMCCFLSSVFSFRFEFVI